LRLWFGRGAMGSRLQQEGEGYYRGCHLSCRVGSGFFFWGGDLELRRQQMMLLFLFLEAFLSKAFRCLL